MLVHLTLKSSNSKTGPIPVSMTEKNSCPPYCSLKDKDCYARFSYLGMQWAKLSNGKMGTSWADFCKRLSKLPEGTLWRHNQAGDLPQGEDQRIDPERSEALLNACQHTKGFTYTHYDPNDPKNADVLKKFKGSGLTVNLSADSPEQADQYADLCIAPVVCLLPKDSETQNLKTPAGRTIVVCPAQTNEEITCSSCKLCQVGSRKSIVGFLAHGSGAKRLSKMLNKE